MSRAVVFDAYGDPDVLHVIDVEPPVPGPGQVRVRVKAAGVQPFDSLFRSGTARQFAPASFPQRLGNEITGVVDTVGEGVSVVSAGDEVIGWTLLNAYAEHAVTDAGNLVAKPANMPWTEAGVLSASGQTASTALEELKVGPGDTVLIHAAAGGVGSFAVQIAKALGATVVGTGSSQNHEYLRGLGAIPVAYGEGLADRVRAAAPGGIDASLVAAGSVEALEASIALVSDKSRIVTVAFHPMAEKLGIRRIGTKRSVARLASLTRLYAEGKLRVSIQAEYPLERANDAHRAIETGHVRGKIVLVV